ncbi:hypothetical protein BDQ12DRAFT_728931 [Crucibulum laeve]|uniref:Uncharacterized protein n=1 Tax=Crucibulum laeve TaxID=68775 RepID=A0A5C3LG74_9AGAR|nr:hypothetical protein BDQ12DRAFT_728931 [Crucibulum laeve]
MAMPFLAALAGPRSPHSEKYVTRAEYDDLKTRFEQLAALVHRYIPASALQPSITSSHSAPSHSHSTSTLHSTSILHTPTTTAIQPTNVGPYYPMEVSSDSPYPAPAPPGYQSMMPPPGYAAPGSTSLSSTGKHGRHSSLGSLVGAGSPVLPPPNTSAATRRQGERSPVVSAAKNSPLSLAAITSPYSPSTSIGYGGHHSQNQPHSSSQPSSHSSQQQHQGQPKNSPAQTLSMLGERLRGEEPAAGAGQGVMQATCAVVLLTRVAGMWLPKKRKSGKWEAESERSTDRQGSKAHEYNTAAVRRCNIMDIQHRRHLGMDRMPLALRISSTVSRLTHPSRAAPRIWAVHLLQHLSFPGVLGAGMRLLGRGRGGVRM